jgi:hypothetical protein
VDRKFDLRAGQSETATAPHSASEEDLSVAFDLKPLALSRRAIETTLLQVQEVDQMTAENWST